MLHVGLTENLDHSVASMAAGLGFNLSSSSHRSTNRNHFAYDAPGFDMDQLITYNASRIVPKGEMTTITIREARYLLIKLNRELMALNKKLEKLEPNLQELVDKEDAWLEEKDNKEKKGERGSMKSGNGTSVLGGILGWIKKSVEGLPSWPPKVAAASDPPSDTDLDDDDDDNDSSSDDGANGTTAEEENNDETEEESQLSNEKIDSPWAEEIEALDAEVFELQQQRDAIQRDIDELLSNELVKGPPMPEGPAQLLVPDSDLEDKKTSLGLAYRQCSKSATKKASQKRRTAFKDLVTPWHESFGFSSAERKALDPAILERIRELNRADMEIWELGKALLEEAILEQEEKKTLQELPPPIVDDNKNATTTTDVDGKKEAPKQELDMKKEAPKQELDMKHRSKKQVGRDEL
jgi:hypothetical protein